MKIDSIRVGFIATNCYLLCDEEAGVCALIDPGDKPEQVADMVSRSGCRLEYILLTHGHFDHTTAVRPLLEKYPDVPVYIHEKDVTDQPPKHMDMMFSRLPEHNQRYYKEGGHPDAGQPHHPCHGDAGPHSGLRMSAGRGRDVLRRHPVPWLLWPHGLRRRRLQGHAGLAGPAGGAARQLQGLSRP